MSDPRKTVNDPNEVVELEDGSKVRPGRFVDNGEGMTILDDDGKGAEDDDLDPDAPEDE